jgi:hypothetical protein
MWLPTRRAPYGVLAAAAAFVTLATTASAAPSSTLAERQTLPSGQSLSSPSGQYLFAMGRDGNLTLTARRQVLWASRTAGNPGARLTLQPDGDVVVYSSRNAPLWASNLRGPLGARYHLTVQDDGNVVVYSAAGKPLAATRTNQSAYRNPRNWARFWQA